MSHGIHDDIAAKLFRRIRLIPATQGISNLVPAALDQQVHGATGVSQWTPLARMYARQRNLRLADGPDEVHHMVVGRNEARKYEGERYTGLDDNLVLK